MKHTVERLLQPVQKSRKTLSISMDSQQMEMLDKLALFFTKKSGHKLSRSQVIEEALGGFITESVAVIQEQFELDIRLIPLAELERNSCDKEINVTELDTMIVPARDNDLYRDDFFLHRCWRGVRALEEKLEHMRYLAVYVGAPTSGITHYAKIASYQADVDNPGRFIILLEDAPAPLPHTVAAGDMTAAAGMRSCRYTALRLLMAAQTLNDLFPEKKV